MPADKRVQSRSQVGFGGEPSGDSEGETDLGYPAQHASSRGQANIVDLRIRAPHAATRDRNLEFSGEVIEVVIPTQHSRRLERQRRSVATHVRVHSRDRATGNIACDIAAGTHRVQSDSRERFEYIWKGLDRDPVQLDVLADGDIGNSVSVAAAACAQPSSPSRTHATP